MATAAFAAWNVWGLKQGAALFPLITSTGLFISGLLLFVTALRPVVTDEPDEDGEYDERPLLWEPMVRLFVMTALFATVVPWVGFYPATFLYLAIMFSLFSDLRPRHGFVTAIVLTVLIYVIFSVLMEVPTPPGSLIELLS